MTTSNEDIQAIANSVSETQDLLLSFLPQDSQEAAKPMLSALLNTYFVSAGESERVNFVTELRAAKSSYDEDGSTEAIVALATRFGVTKDALAAMMPAAKSQEEEVQEIRSNVSKVTSSGSSKTSSTGSTGRS